MAQSLRFKLYNSSREYVGATRHVEDAAAFVALLGAGATVRDGHRKVIWQEGDEDFPAADSYDAAGEVMLQRISSAGLVRR